MVGATAAVGARRLGPWPVLLLAAAPLACLARSKASRRPSEYALWHTLWHALGSAAAFAALAVRL